MFKVESLDREFSKTVDLIGYYVSLERFLAKEYDRLGSTVEDSFAKRLLHLMAKASCKNAGLLRAIIDQLSNMGLVDRSNVVEGWSNISLKMNSRSFEGEDLQQSLRRYLAFEEYLKMEYRAMAEYFSSAALNEGSSISSKLSTVADSHEEYYSILKNLLKISDMDEMLASIIG